MGIVDNINDAQIKQTEHLIEEFGQDIALYRPETLVDDGAGGKMRTGNDTTFAPKRRYFAGITSVGRGATTNPEKWMQTDLGERFRSTHVLIGLPGDDIQAGDTFVVGKKTYKVLVINDASIDYETKAEVRHIA